MSRIFRPKTADKIEAEKQAAEFREAMVTLALQQTGLTLETENLAKATAVACSALNVPPAENTDGEWQPGELVQEGYMRSYGVNQYECIQAHVTQAGWEPDVVPALWKEVSEPDEDGIIEWFEPTSTKYYTLGDKVRYTDGHVYESLLNVNTYSPVAYPAGWKLLN